MKGFTLGLVLLVGCHSGEADYYCGETLWQFQYGTVVNEGFRAGDECFQVEHDGDRTEFRIPLADGGDCVLAGTRAGDVVALDEGECVVPSYESLGGHLFHRWHVTGGTSTYADPRWGIRAELDMVIVFHDGAWGDLDVELGTGSISHDGSPVDDVAFDQDFGHPCTPAARYHATITGQVVSAIGSMESSDMLLAQLGASAEYDYTFAGDGRTVSYGEADITYALLPDRCLVVFDESSDGWQSQLDLDAETLVITTRQNGPFVPGSGAGQCVLEWTGTVVPA